jgi:hypothetical protein
MIHRQTTEQGRRDQRIPCQSADNVPWQFRCRNGGRGQRAVSGDGPIEQHEYEWRRDILSRILAGLGSEMAIERFDTARKCRADVMRCEWLDPG